MKCVTCHYNKNIIIIINVGTPKQHAQLAMSVECGIVVSPKHTYWYNVSGVLCKVMLS